MTITPVLAELRAQYHQAFERHAGDEDVRFELSIMPLPAQNDKIIGMLVLYVEIAGPVKSLHGQSIKVMELHQQAQSPDAIDKHARETLEDLLRAREEEMDQIVQGATTQPAESGLDPEVVAAVLAYRQGG